MRPGARHRHGVLAALAVVALAGEAAAGGPRVGVVVTTRVNVSEAEADRVAGELGEALRGELEIEVVAGGDARKKLPLHGVAVDCVARKECVRDVAARLEGDQLLFLVVVKIGNSVQIESTWADARTGATVSRPAVVVEAGAETRFAGAPPRLLPDAEPRTTRLPPAPAPAADPALDGEVGAPDAPAIATAAAPGPYRARRRVSPAVVVAGAVSATALFAGGAFALSARGDYHDLEDDGCAERACPGADARVDRMERKALAADLLFGAAIAAGATAVVLHFTGSAEEPPVRVGATGDGATLSLGGRF